MKRALLVAPFASLLLLTACAPSAPAAPTATPVTPPTEAPMPTAPAESATPMPT